MRAVLDTNVVVAGLLWQWPPQKILLRAMEGKVMLATSPALLSELEGILHRSKFARQIAKQPLSIQALLLRYAELARVVMPAAIPPVILNDPRRRSGARLCTRRQSSAYCLWRFRPAVPRRIPGYSHRGPCYGAAKDAITVRRKRRDREANGVRFRETQAVPRPTWSASTNNHRPAHRSATAPFRYAAGRYAASSRSTRGCRSRTLTMLTAV